MTQAIQETGGAGRIEPTMSVAHSLMRDWIDLFMKNRRSFILSPHMTGLTLSDQQFALNIPLPQDFRDTLRQEQAWFIAIPVGSDSWRCQVTTPEELSNPTQRSVLRKTYLTVIKQVARTMESRGDEIYTEGDFVSLQEMARELYEALPPGMKQNLANRSPDAVFTTLQR